MYASPRCGGAKMDASTLLADLGKGHVSHSSVSGVPSVRRYYNQQDGHWYVQLAQGDAYVTREANEVLTTVLGSCIAACLRDPVSGVGGMNHFLLPEGDRSTRKSSCFGQHAMDDLIDAMIRSGAQISRMQAKLFGGANVLSPLADVGARNAVFAQEYLAAKGIPVVGGSVGGFTPRRIHLWPLSGYVRQYAVQHEARQFPEFCCLQAKRA